MVQIVFASSGTIDVTDRYAWGENVGWLDFGSSQGNVTVTDSGLTGYAWGENIGWVSLNCSNTSSCDTVSYSVVNDTSGDLDGYAWSENVGWINFTPGQGADPSINSSGEFIGYAWGENIGWINFNCSNTSSCATVDFKTKTSWRPSTASGGGGPVAVAPPPSSTTTSPTTSTSPLSTSVATPITSSLVSPRLPLPVRSSAPPQHAPTSPVTQPPIESPSGITPTSPPIVSEQQQPFLKKITSNVVETTKQISSSVSVVTAVGVAISTAASAVSLATSGISWFNYLEFIFKNILVFFGLKKKTRAWGTIYNSETKQPLPFTKVQLLGKDLRVLESRVTDKEGRYGFLVQEGEFFIAPFREGFTFPSTRVTGPTDTMLYSQVYNGGIATAQTQELVKLDIPMDPVAPATAPSYGGARLPKVHLHNALANIANVMFWIALVFVPLNYILHPTTLNLVMLIIFAALNLVIIVGDLRQRPYGIVLDRTMSSPVPYSLITLNDPSGARRGFTVSDEQGRYFLLSHKGSFKISAYTPAQVNPPRSTEETFTTNRGWIARKLNL
ncbi:MAG: hypothetical protein AAB420_02870 [Patescibacteria group bacterium]